MDNHPIPHYFMT